MPESKVFLDKVHIKNFLSLRNVTLPLKPLTVLVGPNASGKSNFLRALGLFMQMINAEKLPREEIIQNSIWAGGANNLTFQFYVRMDKTPTVYKFEIITEDEDLTINEELIINGMKVISIQGGQGEVWDEDGINKTVYKAKPNKISLGSAGDYGKRPFTSKVTEFFQSWNCYDLQPELMRGFFQTPPFGFDPDSILERSIRFGKFSQLENDGSNLTSLLSNWCDSEPALFEKINELLFASANLKIGCSEINGFPQLYILEGYKNPIPFNRASEGTLHLIAYFILLNQPELPTLLAIEEPERHLHPGALNDIAGVLEQLSEQTQVIITTHSSQLLDAFDPDKLSDSLGVLLLRKRSGIGTEVLNLQEIKDKREALDGWIADFGIGSAIFDSELLQDLMEEPV